MTLFRLHLLKQIIDVYRLGYEVNRPDKPVYVLDTAAVDVYKRQVYALLKEAPSPKEIASMHMTHMANLLKVNSHGHFTKEKAKELRVIAQKSVGANDSAISVSYTHLAAPCPSQVQSTL